ncbi:hypothetical protein GGI35DRAFT_233393 [Trichoderma velutinum]
MMNRNKEEEEQRCCKLAASIHVTKACSANEDMRRPAQLRNNRDTRLVAVAASCSVLPDSLSPAVDIFFICSLVDRQSYSPLMWLVNKGKKPVELPPSS